MFRTLFLYSFWLLCSIVIGLILPVFLLKGGALAYSHVVPQSKQAYSFIASKAKEVQLYVKMLEIGRYNVVAIQEAFAFNAAATLTKKGIDQKLPSRELKKDDKIRSIKKAFTLLHIKPETLAVGAIYAMPQELDSPCPAPNQNLFDLNLFNANRQNSIGKYVPQDLTPIQDIVNTRGKDICLVEETALQFEKMYLDAQKAGVQMVITSGFRDFETQEWLYNYLIEKNEEDFEMLRVAAPGYSEHQLGTTVDITGPSVDYESASASFALSPEYTWLEENAHAYGFAQSYPEGSEYITGYIYEPWHWRYVGVENATSIKESGLTIIEFLEK